MAAVGSQGGQGSVNLTSFFYSENRPSGDHRLPRPTRQGDRGKLAGAVAAKTGKSPDQWLLASFRVGVPCFDTEGVPPRLQHSPGFRTLHVADC